MRQLPVNILLVEDDEDLLLGIARSLGRLEGVQHVTTTHSAEAALEELARRPYALVLSDVRLKGMDGLELLSRIRQAQLPTRVLLMTAFPGAHIELQARRLGSDGLVEKPFELAELRAQVSRLLGAARREAAKHYLDRTEELMQGSPRNLL